jgi:hypothetical protein
MNKQIKYTLFRYIIPASLLLMIIVYPALLSSPRPAIDWLIRIYFWVWLSFAFWHVPDPYKPHQNNWWKPVYVNWSERSLRIVFFMHIGGFGIVVAVIVWFLVSFFAQISFPFSPAIAFVYGLLFILGMLPAYPEFKQTYSEELNPIQ